MTDTGPSLRLDVDLSAGVPPYEQIRAQISAHVAAGHLRPGDRLPTIRALAADLGLAAGTVARAYRELEAAGTATTRRRTGTVVAPQATTADIELSVLAREFVSRARSTGLTDPEILDLVRGSLIDP